MYPEGTTRSSAAHTVTKSTCGWVPGAVQLVQAYGVSVSPWWAYVRGGQNVEIARRNFAMNGNPANIQIVEAGLWSSPGKVRFSAGQSAQSAVLSTEAASDPAKADAIEIETHSLKLRRL